MNWLIATEQEYNDAGITFAPTARRFMLDTYDGEVEVILQHVNIHEHDLGTIARKMANGILTDEELQYVLPVEVGE